MDNRSSNEEARAQKPIIGLSLMTYNNPFFIALRNAVRTTAKKQGCSLIENNAEFDATKQLAAVEDFLIRGTNAIILNPADSAAAVTAVAAANAKGVPVICVDVKADGGKIATFVASDNERLGVLTGEYLAKRLGGRGKIALVGHPTVNSGSLRAKGLKSVLSSYPEIKIVAEQASMGDRVKAMEVTENILTVHTDIKAIWAVNDPSALGCVTAVEAAGFQDRVFVVGIDGSPEATKALKTSRVFVATAAQYPQEMGKIAVEMALKAIRGDSCPPFVPTRISLITRENLDAFTGWE